MSKGDKQRPTSVSREESEANWKEAFSQKESGNGIGRPENETKDGLTDKEKIRQLRGGAVKEVTVSVKRQPDVF